MKQTGWRGMMDGDESHSSDQVWDGYEPCWFNCIELCGWVGSSSIVRID
jgi:hypothetical protein